MRAFSAHLLVSCGTLWMALSGICAALDAARADKMLELVTLVARTSMLVGAGYLLRLAGRALETGQDG